MSREEALRDEDDRRCTDQRSISFPGKIGVSPDDWPVLGPVPYEDKEGACPCACHWHEDDGSPWHIKPCCDQPVGSRLVPERPECCLRDEGAVPLAGTTPALTVKDGQGGAA